MILHIVPKDIHERIVALGIETYRDVFNAKTLQDTLPINDMVKLQLARDSFPFDFEANLGIKVATAPLEMFQALSEEEGLEEEHPMVNRLRWAIELAKEKQNDIPDIVHRYTLVPIEGDTWVVVQQSVHRGEVHPDEALLRENSAFFDQLIASLYYEVGFNDIAKTTLMSLYLGSLRYHSDI